MAHTQENHLMIRFYLSSPSLQRALLDDYQHLTGRVRNECTFIDFLEENFETKAVLEGIYSNMRPQAFPQISV